MEFKMDYTVDKFDRDLSEPYAWPGGYPRYFICSDGAALSFAAASDCVDLIRDAIAENDTNSGWRVIGCDINWEDAELYCDHTGERIESAYAEQ
jgi:hypothetical protein